MPSIQDTPLGLINEICGDTGFAWNARLLMLNAGYVAIGPEAVAKNPMYAEYQFEADAAESIKDKIESFLAYLSDHIKAQRDQDSDHLVGNQLTAADVYWAYFSNMLQALPPEQNPMPEGLRKSWGVLAASISGYDPILIEQRDRTFANYLSLPLEF